MSNLPGRWLTAAFSMAVMLTASPTHAQLTSTVYVSGLSNPVAFVQDPSNAAVQYSRAATWPDPGRAERHHPADGVLEPH